MKKITRKITTEEFQDGELVKRTIEETTEEITDSQLVPIGNPIKVGDKTPPWEKLPRTWCTTVENNIALL